MLSDIATFEIINQQNRCLDSCAELSYHIRKKKYTSLLQDHGNKGRRGMKMEKKVRKK